MSFICIVCESNEVTFDDIDSLEAHIASDHIRQFNYQCPQCPFEQFCTETILHEHCIAVHQCDDYEASYQGNKQMLEQRARLRSLLFDSMKYSSTNVDNHSATIVDGDGPLMATPAIHLSFDKDQQKDVDGDSMMINLNALFASTTPIQQSSVARVVMPNLTKIRTPMRQNGKEIGKKHNSAPPLLSIAMNDEKQIKCCECDQLICNKQINMRRHGAVHVDKVMFECQLCGYEVRRLRKDVMNEHIDKVHPGVVYKTVTTSHLNKCVKELEEMCIRCFGYKYKPRNGSKKEK